MVLEWLKFVLKYRINSSVSFSYTPQKPWSMAYQLMATVYSSFHFLWSSWSLAFTSILYTYLIKVIHSFLTGRSALLSLETDHLFYRITMGFPQGGVLSPFFWNIFIDISYCFFFLPARSSKVHPNWASCHGVNCNISHSAIKAYQFRLRSMYRECLINYRSTGPSTTCLWNTLKASLPGGTLCLWYHALVILTFPSIHPI